MKAYIIVDVDIHDPVTYDRYKDMAPPSIAAYGGRYVVRGGKVATLEGNWTPRRFVMLEFPSADAARAWWGSPEYAEAKTLRQSVATTQMILVEGPPLDLAAPGRS